ncbi:hypothetical protein THAOC_33069, partial [Thalassiosira oceanica]
MNFSSGDPSASYDGLDSKAFSLSHRAWISSSDAQSASRFAVPLGRIRSDWPFRPSADWSFSVVVRWASGNSL